MKYGIDMSFSLELNYLGGIKLLQESWKDDIWKKEKCLIKAIVGIFVSTGNKTYPSTKVCVVSAEAQ